MGWTDYTVQNPSINEPLTYAHFPLLPMSHNEPSVNAPMVPSIVSIVPSTAVHGASDLTMQVNGIGFGAWSAIVWNGVKQTTTFVNNTQLTMLVKVSTAARGNYSVSVINGSYSSGALNFRMT